MTIIRNLYRCNTKLCTRKVYHFLLTRNSIGIRNIPAIKAINDHMSIVVARNHITVGVFGRGCKIFNIYIHPCLMFRQEKIEAILVSKR